MLKDCCHHACRLSGAFALNAQIVFPEAIWVGTAEENPEEVALPMPGSLQTQRHENYVFRGEAAEEGDVRHATCARPQQWLVVTRRALQAHGLQILQMPFERLISMMKLMAFMGSNVSVLKLKHRSWLTAGVAVLAQGL